MTTETETLRTPQEWCLLTGIRILDPDGWRTMSTEQREATGVVDGLENVEVPIARDDFIKRAGVSTVARWPHPLYDEREEPSLWFVERLAFALRSEFGAQFGMGLEATDEHWKKVARVMALKMRAGESDESGGTMIVAFDPKVGP